MKLALSALISVLVLSTSAHAAEGNWKRKHPRRAEVNQRDRSLRNQTESAEKNGKITDAQAQRLERQENAIHNQEKADASAHGGHITKEEQRKLNREENRVNQELRNDEHKDANRAHQPPTAPAPTAPAPAAH